MHPSKEKLPISLREKDKGLQPGERPENTLLWIENIQPALYGQWLAWQITIEYAINSVKGVEPVTGLESYNLLQPKVIVKSKKKAIKDTSKSLGLVLWIDSWELDQGQVAATVFCEEKSSAKWREKNIFLGKNKEILDAEL